MIENLTTSNITLNQVTLSETVKSNMWTVGAILLFADNAS